MGIKVPSGECEIKFDYVTPGLKAGAIITVITALVLLGYYIVLKKVYKYKPNADCHLYESEQIDELDNHNDYIRMLTRKADRERRKEVK